MTRDFRPPRSTAAGTWVATVALLAVAVMGAAVVPESPAAAITATAHTDPPPSDPQGGPS
jgi:hypothetical protein